jgi:hypothetical protein
MNGCDLKKQSQFTGWQIGVNSCLKGGYGNVSPCGAQKTKPIQSQFNAPALTKRVGKREKSLGTPPHQKDEAEIFDFEWHSE